MLQQRIASIKFIMPFATYFTANGETSDDLSPNGDPAKPYGTPANMINGKLLLFWHFQYEILMIQFQK